VDCERNVASSVVVRVRHDGVALFFYLPPYATQLCCGCKSHHRTHNAESVVVDCSGGLFCPRLCNCPVMVRPDSAVDSVARNGIDSGWTLDTIHRAHNESKAVESGPRLSTLIHMRFNSGVLLFCLTVAGCSNSKYEVIERSQRDVPNFMQPGTHTEVNYVLLHDGHKISASCDTTTIDSLDRDATCGFRPLHTYDCELQSDSMSNAMKSKLPMSDLKCKDADGHNVYLYVSKKD
jgi:hypothetical protein